MRRLFAGIIVSSVFFAAPVVAQGRGQAKPDSATRTLEREVFSYSGSGRRDPMLSLVTSGDIRPLITELELIAIIYDEAGSNSIALLRNTKDSKHPQYRVKVGQQLGRMRITQITRKEVVFTLDEFGFSRQLKLSVKPDTTARTP